MSKYIKLEDVIKTYADSKMCKHIFKKKGLDLVERFFADLPPIEVSEDCISREYLEEQYWQTLIPKGMINTDVELGINIGIDKMHDVIKNAPSVVPSCQKNRQVERAEGEWVLSDIQCQEDNDDGNYAYVCTNCKHTDIHGEDERGE